MGERAEQWRRSVDPHFGYLTGLGFSEVDLDLERSPWSVGAVPLRELCGPGQ